MAETGTQDWPQRNWAIAILGALFGLAIQQLAEGTNADDAVHAALATALMTGGVVFAFTLDRDRIRHSVAFALLSALLVGATVYLNSGLAEMDTGEGWKLLCSVLAVVVAAPLFQAWCAAGQPQPRLTALAYPRVHDRAWMNILLWFACWAFAAVVFLLGQLLAELFSLIGIRLVRKAMEESWFVAMLMGGAFGAASGLLRDRESLLVTLQTVVRRVLSVLGPVLGFGLILFLLALPFTGLHALWEATKSTTPILLSCVVGALILSNAAIGDSSEDETHVAILRWGATALGVAMLPLAIIAAISTGLRIAQYGLTPERLWAVVFVGIALAFGGGYLWVILRQRMGWFAGVRPLNLWLAAGLCLLAFLLATPLVNFGAWSTASQLARLESGKVSVAKFDWAALRFSFGEPGRHALKKLARTGSPDVRKAAAKALALTNVWDARTQQEDAMGAETLVGRLIVKPVAVALPQPLLARLSRYDACGRVGRCVVFYAAGAQEAVVAGMPCDTCGLSAQRLVRDVASGTWEWDAAKASSPPLPDADLAAKNKADMEALRNGNVEVRAVERRQVFVSGKPVGIPFE